jgi:hypothetical protein
MTTIAMTTTMPTMIQMMVLVSTMNNLLGSIRPMQPPAEPVGNRLRDPPRVCKRACRGAPAATMPHMPASASAVRRARLAVGVRR